MKIMRATLSLEIQNFFKMLYLFLKFSHECVVLRTYLVRSDFSHDLFRSVSELKSWNGLLGVVDDWTHSRDERRLRVASQTVLEEACDLWVTVRDVRFAFALRQCLNHLS